MIHIHFDVCIHNFHNLLQFVEGHKEPSLVLRNGQKYNNDRYKILKSVWDVENTLKDVKVLAVSVNVTVCKSDFTLLGLE